MFGGKFKFSVLSDYAYDLFIDGRELDLDIVIY